MKHLKDYIKESLFDDNVKSDIVIHDVKIYMPEWKLCEEYFQKRRKKYFGNKSTVNLGDMEDEYTILYNEKDCVICVDKESDEDSSRIYILCPETIYMNYQTAEIIYGSYNNCISLTNINEANDFSICFCWDTFFGWSNLEGCYNINDQRKLEKEVGVYCGYLPETISSKAQNIIKKYMND